MNEMHSIACAGGWTSAPDQDICHHEHFF